MILSEKAGFIPVRDSAPAAITAKRKRRGKIPRRRHSLT
jgi:hypothetical protein